MNFTVMYAANASVSTINRVTINATGAEVSPGEAKFYMYIFYRYISFIPFLCEQTLLL